MSFGLFQSSQSSESHFEVGGIYSIRTGDRKYRIAKILILGEGEVHIRLYKTIYTQRPLWTFPDTLAVGSPIDDPNEFGIRHVPLSREGFMLMEPVFLVPSTVSEDELDGYEMWKDSGEGNLWDVFSDDEEFSEKYTHNQGGDRRSFPSAVQAAA